MQITEGLFDHMVLQRTSRNVSAARFSGTASGDGTLRATVRRGNRPLPGFKRVALGRVAHGRFSACLMGLPVGGPYDILLQVTGRTGVAVDSISVRDVLVGDVWLLGGQSNMQGIGLLKNGPKADPLVRAFYMDDRWAPAKDPIHNLWGAVDRVHLDLNGGMPHVRTPGVGACPGPSFGLEMKRLTGGVPQGLIACAHGGTSMAQWDPALKKLGSGSLYGALLRRFRKNGSSVAGFLWYQGCSDAIAVCSGDYTGRMKRFVAALRRDCGDPGLPVAIVQIGRVIGWAEKIEHWNSIQEQQRRLANALPDCALVPAIDLPLDDTIHISGAGQVRLGRRLAYAMNVIRQGPRAGKPPITVDDVSVVADRGLATITVRFGNVEGTLRAGGRPTGFSVVSRASTASSVFDTQLKRNTAVIRTGDTFASLSNKSLYYGHGFDPASNVTDEADRSLPVFGPIPLAPPYQASQFVQILRVGKLQMSAGNLEKLRLPSLKSMDLRQREFPTAFCERLEDIRPHAARDPMLTYVCGFRCAKPMKLLIRLGHGGPLKMWVDGREVYHQPVGNNNAMPDMTAVPFTASRGTHQIVIAMGTNKGNAWGIYLRLDRHGRAGAKIPASYTVMRRGRPVRRRNGRLKIQAMPEVLG